MKVRRSRSSLRTQIFLRVLVVGLVPLVLLATLALWGLRNLENTTDQGVEASRETMAAETVTAHLHSEARAVGREIDLVLAERINDVITWSSQPAIISGSEAARQLAAANELIGLSLEEAEARFAGAPTLGAAPAADAFLSAELARRGGVLDIIYTDSNGFNAGVVGVSEDFVQSDEEWWQEAWANGLYVGEVTLHPESSRYVIPVSSRIDNDRGSQVGVLKASLSIAFIQTISDIRTEDDLDVSVITSERVVLADTASGHSPDLIGVDNLSADDLSPGLLNALAQGDGSSVEDSAVLGFTTVSPRRAAETANGPADGQNLAGPSDWSIVTSQTTEVAFAPLAGLDDLNRDLSSAGRTLSLATIILLLGSAAGAAVAAAVLSRKLVNPIKVLTERARWAADYDLPSAVSRARDSAEVELGEDPTIELNAGNELDELAASFNSVQHTAIRLAGEQAHQRHTATEMMANLGRRNQSLVKRQLRFIDDLEQSEEDPDRLAALFRLDHLATRMRRNAESLLVIAGHRANTGRAAPVRVELVVQAALGEVENFERVTMTTLEPAALAGRTVADIAHVLAELTENALAFSPPKAPVMIEGTEGETHYTLTVTDRGLGLSADELTAANRRITADDSVDLTPSKQLGFLVVSRLSARHGLSVELKPVDNGGTAAVVSIPKGIVSAAGEAPALPPQQRTTDDTSTKPGTDTKPGTKPDTEPITPQLEPVPSALWAAPSVEDVHEATPPSDAPHEDPVPPTEPTPSPLPPSAPDEVVPLEPIPVAGTTAPAPLPAPVFEPRPAVARSVSEVSPEARDPYLGGLSAQTTSQISPVNRRASRRSLATSRKAPTPTAKRAVATTDSAEEVEREAAELSNRWSSFQQGRRNADQSAETEVDDTDG